VYLYLILKLYPKALLSILAWKEFSAVGHVLDYIFSNNLGAATVPMTIKVIFYKSF
jgi:hypothetical protein